MLTDTFPSSGSIHVLCLYSGGLDSRLTLCLLREYGLRVRALTFHHPLSNSALPPASYDDLGIPIEHMDFTATLARVLMDWSHGLTDDDRICFLCRAAMLRKAWEHAVETGCHFIATGDVIEQRQAPRDLADVKLLDEAAGCAGWVVRPLSGALLDPTVPEQRGWIDRAQLLGLYGRHRKDQEELADKFGLEIPEKITDDCRLSDDRFLARVKDLCLHEGIQGKRSLDLLRIGRHFRLDRSIKLIVGRNEQENMRIQGDAELYDLLLYPEDAPGPTGLLSFSASNEHIQRAAAICARYSDRGEGQPVRMRIRSPRGMRTIETRAASAGEVDPCRI